MNFSTFLHGPIEEAAKVVALPSLTFAELSTVSDTPYQEWTVEQMQNRKLAEIEAQK